MNQNEKWLEWAVALQSLAQAGLYYGKDPFDVERYEQIRTIAAEMISYQTENSGCRRSKTCSATKRAIKRPSWTAERRFFRMKKFSL